MWKAFGAQPMPFVLQYHCISTPKSYACRFRSQLARLAQLPPATYSTLRRCGGGGGEGGGGGGEGGEHGSAQPKCGSSVRLHDRGTHKTNGQRIHRLQRRVEKKRCVAHVKERGRGR